MKKTILVLLITLVSTFLFLSHPHISQAATFFNDDFTGLDNTTLSQHNSAWTLTNGSVTDASISNNQLLFPFGSTWYELNGFSTKSDQCVASDFNVNSWFGGDFALFTRESTNGYYEFSIGDWYWLLSKRVGSTSTPLVSGSRHPFFESISALKICAVGSVVDAFLNGTLVASISDSSVSQGAAGIFADQPVIIDNFVYTDAAEVSPYPTPIAQAPPSPTSTLPVLFQDNFTDSNGADLHSHNPAWINQVGQGYIFNNQLNFGYYDANFNHYTNAIYTLDGFANQTSQCLATDFNFNQYWGGDFGLDARYSATGRYEMTVGGGGTTWQVQKWLGSAETTLASGSVDISTINALKFCVVGSVLDAYINGTLVASVSDSSITQGTGGVFTDQPFVIDNFVYTDGSEVSPYPTPPNTSPSIGTIPNATINQGTYTASGAFTDADSTSWTATVDYGDGSGVQSLALSGTNFSLSHQYTMVGNYTVTVRVTDNQGAVGTGTGVVAVQRQLTALTPAKVWISRGALNFNAKFDLLAEVYKDSALVSSGQVNAMAPGNNPTLETVPFNSFSPLNFPAGSVLKLKVSVRKACGLLQNAVNATLSFNDATVTSQFGATLGSSSNTYFLRNSFALAATAGSGPRQNITVSANCNTFTSIGTWTITP